MMAPIAWGLVGLLCALIATLVTKEQGEEYFGDILFGIGGASVGGLIGLWIGWWSMMGVSLHCIVLSFIGAIVGLIIYHMLFLRYTHSRHGPLA